MALGGQPASSLKRSKNRVAEIVGIAIAILTLALPLTVIAYYSNSPDLPPTRSSTQQSGSR